QRQVELGGPASEGRRRGQIPVFQRGEEGRRGRRGGMGREVALQPFLPLLPSPPAPCRDPLVVATQLVDSELPPRSLMLDHALHDRERARLEPWPQVLEASGERGNP